MGEFFEALRYWGRQGVALGIVAFLLFVFIAFELNIFLGTSARKGPHLYETLLPVIMGVLTRLTWFVVWVFLKGVWVGAIVRWMMVQALKVIDFVDINGATYCHTYMNIRSAMVKLQFRIIWSFGFGVDTGYTADPLLCELMFKGIRIVTLLLVIFFDVAVGLLVCYLVYKYVRCVIWA